MVFFPSIKTGEHLTDVFKRFPNGVGPLLQLHDEILRQDSDLTISQRELIAAFVSGLNRCDFCFNAHITIAQSFGIEAKLFEELLEDINSSTIDENLKPILHYVKKLTLEPARLTQKDATAVFEAGWSEDALHNAIQVCALFNFMNRIIFGSGIPSHFDLYAEKRKILEPGEAMTSTYRQYGLSNGLIDN